MPEIKLLLVADDPLARAGLSSMLALEPDFEILGQVNGNEVVEELADGLLPDVIIWDIGWEMPEKLPDWLDKELDIPIIALLPPVLPDETPIQSLWEAGIKGLLNRQTNAQTLAATIHTAVHNLTILDNDIAAALLPTQHHRDEGEANIEPLTPREQEVLHLLAEGLTNKAIAHQLHISEHTIKFHVNAIMGKLNAQSRTDAVVRATRLGILAL